MLNIIYDATLVANNFQKNHSRSGIFFVAWNLLLEIKKRNDVNLFLYLDPSKAAEATKIRNSLGADIPFIFDYTKHPFYTKLNTFFWTFHTKIYKHSILRKPFALGILFTQFILKQKLCKEDITPKIQNKKFVFFSPALKIPPLIRNYKDISTFTFIHDAIPYLFPEINSVKWVLDGIFTNQDNNDFFFCNSNQTFNDFKKNGFKLNEKNSIVTYLAANQNFHFIQNDYLREELTKKYNIPSNKKYIFSLCTLEPRKNLVRAVRCFMNFIQKHNIEDFIWVMGGGHWDSFIKELQKNGVHWDSKYIIQTGYIDDEDLPVLYSNAEWFVYTSQYEGFGLPPLEAMQCGCPVITSNNSSLPEVVGDAGIMIDWDSDEQHIEAYEQYYFNENLRKENSRKGLERAKLFSWEKTVDKMVETMKNTISS